MYTSISPKIKTIIITISYILLSLLPNVLGNYLTDDIFNYALCILTFTFIAIAHNFSTLSSEFRKFRHFNPISIVLFIITGACFAGFVLAHNYTIMNFSFLYPVVHDMSLVSLMKLFSIGFCLHVNESYLFIRYANAFKKDTRAAMILPAIIYFLVQMFVAFLLKYSLLTAFIYYGVTAILLGLIRDEHEPTHLYIFSAAIVIINYVLLF